MLLYRFTSLSVVYLCCLVNCRWQSVNDIRHYSVYRLLHPII